MVSCKKIRSEGVGKGEEEMKKIFKKLWLFVISTIVFVACIIYGTNLKQDFIVYSDGFVDNGNVKTMNITSFYGFTDEGRDNGLYKGSLGIPESGKVELRIKAKTEKNDKMFVSFRDS
jgi:hypothetical protein